MNKVSKTAVFAFLWAIASTPASTLVLLGWADQAGSAWGWMRGLPYQNRAILVATILIAPPVLALVFATLALQQIREAWTPMRGGGLARTALAIAVASTLLAIAVFCLS